MATNPAMPVPELKMETEKTPSETIVRCSGKLTSSTTESLKEKVRPLILEAKTVVLDLTSVTYMDSSGLGAIVGLYASAQKAGSKLKLINLNHQLKELFRISRLAPIFEGHEDMLGMTPD